MSKRGPEYARQRNEKYYTPHHVTQALIDRERFYGNVWDPAVGAGHILAVLYGNGFPHAYGSDVDPDGNGKPHNFLTSDHDAENIITNPPFGVQGRLGLRFIEQALQRTKAKAGKVAMLLPLEFDSAKTRQHVFRDCPQFAGKYVLTERIRWANLQQKEAGPMANHQWAVWDWRKDPVAPPFARYV